MRYFFYPDKDATIYSNHVSLNAGLDEIIELDHLESGSLQANSRILLQFSDTDISQSIISGSIGSDSRYFLKLYICESLELPMNHDVEFHAVSESWTQGTGKKYSDPAIEDGVSWLYRDGSTEWISSGGTIIESYSASYSFVDQSTDISIDVTNIVSAWLSGSIPNNGFLIKGSDLFESASFFDSLISFFGNETNTIYRPRIEARWDDSIFSTGSLTVLPYESGSIYIRNLRESYAMENKARFRVGIRDRFYTRNFVTESVSYCLPSSSYYSLVDSVTGDVLIPFDDYSKISCDSNGNFFDINVDMLNPFRRYDIRAKIVYDQNSIEEIFKIGSFRTTLL